MKLIITIDTEEDDWATYSPKTYSFENIIRVPVLQELFDRYGAKPTYLITYPVATDEKAISILKGIHDKGRCEIGTHCHPWNTPPFEEENNVKNSMMCNLSSDLQYKKLNALHRQIKKNFGIEPISFRAGRWGYNARLAENLYKLGYKIDTSITPYIDWTSSYGKDFSFISPKPYRFSMENIFKESSEGVLLEVPVTIGFLRGKFSSCNAFHQTLKAEKIRFLRLSGLAYRLGLLNKAWLSPEVSETKDMIGLAKNVEKNKYSVINMVFHSSSLKSGCNQFVKTSSDEKEFLTRISEFLKYAKDSGIEPIMLSDMLRIC